MNFYLNKYGFLPPQLTVAPDPDLGIIVVIPCFNEPDLLSSLKSLAACETPQKKAEVIVVINSGIHHPAGIKDQNLKSLAEAQQWLKNTASSSISFQFILADNLPEKHAGVGLARKIGMDEAVSRFDHIRHDGIIVCFDADSLCDPDYLVEIEKHFTKYPKTPGCSVYFEHPLSGCQEAIIYSGITQYELHLRYYNQALRYCDLPYAFHTVGSSMAVRSSAYQKQGGMNKRKAGEDFYFLHKIIGLGNFSELHSTRVIPSPRISDRVPFGTGKAMGDYIQQPEPIYLTYNFNSFQLIRKFVSQIPLLYKNQPEVLPGFSGQSGEYNALKKFLESENLPVALNEIRRNAPTEKAFVKRFFVWFDAFRVLKLVHFLRDYLYENTSVVEASNALIQARGGGFRSENAGELLTFLRILERNSGKEPDPTLDFKNNTFGNSSTG